MTSLPPSSSSPTTTTIIAPTDAIYFDLTLPLDQVADGYRAMDQRQAIKTLLLPMS